MRRGTFKNTDTMFRALTKARKARRMEAKQADWTEAPHLTEQDREDLRLVRDYINNGEPECAHSTASRLDTIVRDEIPSAIWTQMEEATTKYTAKAIREAGKRLAEMDQNPQINQMVSDLLRLLHG